MEKVNIPKNVANYIEYCKYIELDFIDSYKATHNKTRFFEGNLEEAIQYAINHQEIFAKAWLIGYKVYELKYRVKIKAVTGSTKYLLYGEISDTWYFGKGKAINLRELHTKKDLEDSGFGWVFYCKGVEVTEVSTDG